MGRGIGECEWHEWQVSGGVTRELSEADVKGTLLSAACRNYRMIGEKRSTHKKSKLALMKQTAECVVEPNCAFLKSMVERRMMLKLRV